jgi:AraC-like DNA-binding protein
MGQLVETSADSRANRDLANDLEYNLVSALGEVVAGPLPSIRASGRLHHETIVKRFRDKLEEDVFEPISILDIVQELGVAARTLRAACQEQLGVSPLQYAMLHRLRRVHRRLRDADPNHARVTDIATEHGFWELGRFSVKYRQVFGERPSQTLRRRA